MKNKKIAIIGGGLSGILFAYYLAKDDYEVTIFEKEKNLGGELATIGVDDFWRIEKFYHHLFLNNQDTIGLFSELGLANDIKWYKSKVAVFSDDFLHPFSTAFDLLKLPFLTVVTKVRMGVASLIIPILSGDKFADVTAKDLIVKYMGDEAWKKFWEPIFTLKFANYASKISGSWFWGRLRDRMSTRRSAEILGYPDGGFSVLLNALITGLQHLSVNIKTGHKITKIKQTGTCFLIDDTCFDKVICAVPIPVLNEIIPNLMVTTKHLSVVTILLEMKDKITDYYWINILNKKTSFGVIVEHTNLVPSSNYGEHLLYLGRYLDKNDPLYGQSDNDITKTFLDDLNRIFPFASNNVIRSHVFRDDFAQPIIEKSYTQPKFYTPVAGLFCFSSAHIYPYDRGIDRVITEVKKNLNDSNLLIGSR